MAVAKIDVRNMGELALKPACLASTTECACPIPAGGGHVSRSGVLYSDSINSPTAAGALRRSSPLSPALANPD
jgi:hypothetical protein